MEKKYEPVKPVEGWRAWYETPFEGKRQRREKELKALGFDTGIRKGGRMSRKQQELIRALAAEGKSVPSEALLLADQWCLTSREASAIIESALRGKPLAPKANATEAGTAATTDAAITDAAAFASTLGLGHAPNDDQWKAIQHTDGPLLVIAGPGSGKTATMVNRVLYLVAVKGVDPDQIMMTTFTNKAADEMRSRLSKAFDTATAAGALASPVNASLFHIGTIDSLCLEMIKQCPLSDYADCEIVDEFAHPYQIYADANSKEGAVYKRHGVKPTKLTWLSNSENKSPEEWNDFHWRCAGNFISAYDTAISNGALSILEKSSNGQMRALGKAIEQHRQDLRDSHKLSYSDITAATLELMEDPEDKKRMLGRIRHIIVDEYQDTSKPQQRIMRALYDAIEPNDGESKSLCVVGDDDQSLYRFRGASVENILNFEKTFTPEPCELITLHENYRSQRGIIDFFTSWMNSPDVTWGDCRRLKEPVVAAEQNNETSVVRCVAENLDDWKNEVTDLIEQLMESGRITDYNQVAYLASSVTADNEKDLIDHLEEHGINVYAPRAGRFGERIEVRTAIGCLIRCFAGLDVVASDSGGGGEDSHGGKGSFFRECVDEADGYLRQNRELKDWVNQRRDFYCSEKAYSDDDDKTEKKKGCTVIFSQLFYEMLGLEPFSTWMNTEGRTDLAHTLKARNLKQVLDCLIGYEHMRKLGSFSSRRDAEFHAKQLLEDYIERRFESLDEFQDPEEPCPSGHVLFTTIHQAKGLEFPVVIVGSLNAKPRKRHRYLADDASLAINTDPFEPVDLQNTYDFFRLYYTAFSRAQDLLVLTGFNSEPYPGDWRKRSISDLFRPYVDGVPDWRCLERAAIKIQKTKQPSLVHEYAYTSDIKAYESCPRRYRLTRILGFPTGSTAGMQFGTLVHNSAEAVHQIVIEKGIGALPDDAELESIVSAKYEAIIARDPSAKIGDKAEAVRQLKSYVHNYRDIIANVKEAEIAISAVREGYILKGQIDVLSGEDGKVDIIDFKTGQPHERGSELMESYHKQMCVYAHLVETQTDYEVSGAKLYFPSANDHKGALIDMAVDTNNVEQVMQEFDKVVDHIEKGDFDAPAKDGETCEKCDFRFYCGRD